MVRKAVVEKYSNEKLDDTLQNGTFLYKKRKILKKYYS